MRERIVIVTLIINCTSPCQKNPPDDCYQPRRQISHDSPNDAQAHPDLHSTLLAGARGLRYAQPGSDHADVPARD
jgi:hypothetical protein